MEIRNFDFASKNVTILNFVQFNSLENFLSNFSFVSLFLIMIFYWVQFIFFVIPKFNIIIFISTLFANIALLLLLIFRWLNYGHFPLSNLYESLMFLSWSFTLVQLFFIRPVTNSSLIFNNSNENIFTDLNQNKNQSKNYTSSKLGFHKRKTFLLNNKLKLNSGKKLKKKIFNFDVTSIIGIVLSPIALFTNSFATFSLPKSMQKAQALVPALQSNWLMMHVTVMMLSYAALLCGSLLAIAFLVVMWIYRKSNTNKILNVNNSISNTNNKIILNKNYNNDKIILDDNYKNSTILYNKSELKYSSNLSQTQTSASSQSELVQIFPTQRQTKNNQLDNQLSSIISLAKTLDNFSYRILGIGFPLLTVGILSGAVWANEAWGSYWSWDPKETWAFITWLIFAIYLHIRINKGWQGEKPALLAGFGFFIVWICYLGVNILGTGLHSYGWVKFNA